MFPVWYNIGLHWCVRFYLYDRVHWSLTLINTILRGRFSGPEKQQTKQSVGIVLLQIAIALLLPHEEQGRNTPIPIPRIIQLRFERKKEKGYNAPRKKSTQCNLALSSGPRCPFALLLPRYLFFDTQAQAAFYLLLADMPQPQQPHHHLQTNTNTNTNNNHLPLPLPLNNPHHQPSPLPPPSALTPTPSAPVPSYPSD